LKRRAIDLLILLIWIPSIVLLSIALLGLAACWALSTVGLPSESAMRRAGVPTQFFSESPPEPPSDGS
jgi:hypothetical protein